MRSSKSVPLHLRLVLANGLVLALAVLAMSLAPTGHHVPTAAVVLVAGLALVVAVNTRHLRQGLAPLVAAVGNVRRRWENEHRAQRARSMASREYDEHRMAVALHDNVGTGLAHALVALKKAIDHAPPELAAELGAVRHDTQNSLVEVRRITRRLRPELLEDMGLQSALGFLVSDLGRHNPALHVEQHLEGPFLGIDDEAELVVYRVAEEALANAARHARARHVSLSLCRDDDRVVLRVGDDGVGVGGNGERTGILGMRERAALVGGLLSVGPREGGGTVVRLDVPTHPHHAG
ncbi:MAG TPA: ATP-binding protein [Nocardioidaceae bacterium]|nr:ATP-binding protein [Nocardioidaceae bacterium]